MTAPDGTTGESMSSPKNSPTPLDVFRQVTAKKATPLLPESDADIPRLSAGVGVKSCPVKVKTDGMADGDFLGYASVFGVKDTCGDVVQKGAFGKTLADWASKGQPIPLLWGHNTADPDMNLGEIVTAEEDSHGLKVHGRLDMSNPKAAQTYKLLKSGRVGQMSFAYRVTDGAYVMPESKDGESFYSINSVDLFEVSIVPIGANQDTEILAVKSVLASLQSKAGRVLSAKNESVIAQCYDQLMEVAMALKSVLPPDAGDSQDQEPTSGEEPSAPKSAPTTPTPSVNLANLKIAIQSQEGNLS